MLIINVTVVYRRCAARHRHVFIVVTVVNSPASVSTVSYRHFVTYTVYVVQPDNPGAWTVAISNHRSSVPENSQYLSTTNSRYRNIFYCTILCKMSILDQLISNFMVEVASAIAKTIVRVRKLKSSQLIHNTRQFKKKSIRKRNPNYRQSP